MLREAGDVVTERRESLIPTFVGLHVQRCRVEAVTVDLTDHQLWVPNGIDARDEALFVTDLRLEPGLGEVGIAHEMQERELQTTLGVTGRPFQPLDEEADALRDKRLRALGYEIVRFSEHQIRQRPEFVVRTLRQKLGLNHSRGG